MTGNSLKSKTLKGVFWSGTDRFSYYIIQFVINIVMARLLSPKDYGLISILMVFIGL